MSGFLDDIETLVPVLRRYARALTGNADRADDLVQDCLERAIAKQSLWRPIGPLRPWLFKIMINLHRNDRRRRRGSPEPEALDLLRRPRRRRARAWRWPKRRRRSIACPVSSARRCFSSRWRG